ncbi:hypothetical protein DICVIV_06611 [Dictyocaulus viviparus]|uniref:Uncharacterized protein n=1 Tax=Dictyocaulus viviparus TaxID=29172 RepID=A0A0D8XS19_DICVI|nr:hypothetical protein DICVIV_06611 [Dictyocaulus viviparus]
MLVSLIATALFALGIQDRIMENLSNGSIQWNTVELVYSFGFAVLSVICVWLSFGLASRNLGGTSMGYILAGFEDPLISLNYSYNAFSIFQLFSIVHAILYAIPCAVIYDSMNSSVMQPEQMNNIQTVHPFREYPYHDL